MKITPVKHYNEPAFPVQNVINEHPELLCLVPKKWQVNPVVLTALTAASMLFSSHAFADDKDTGSVSRVAPVFKHGEGQAFYGGDVSNAAVMLSEDEARQVITDEAKKYDIHFLPIAENLTNVPVPTTSLQRNDRITAYGNKKESNESSNHPYNMTLYLDGTDWKRRISFEFVSQTDFAELDSKNLGVKPSAGCQDYRFLDTAMSLQEVLVKKNPPRFHAVFYDPAVRQNDPEFITKATGETDHKAMEALWEKAETEALEKARMELREQVKDFVKWLKAQGVI